MRTSKTADLSTPLPRISYLAELATTTDAALREESRTRFINATTLNRKSGGAEWRDLRFYQSTVTDHLLLLAGNRQFRGRSYLIDLRKVSLVDTEA
jgi:hypothetical protein